MNDPNELESDRVKRLSAERSKKYRKSIRDKAVENERLLKGSILRMLHIVLIVILIAETFINPDIVVRSAYHLLDLPRVQALVARLYSINSEEIFVGLRSSDDRRFHFSEFTLGLYGTNADLQRELLVEASEIIQPLVQSLQLALPSHTRVSVSFLLSLPFAQRQLEHKDWPSEALDDLTVSDYPVSIILPLNAPFIINVHDDDTDPTVCTRQVHVCEGTYVQFRADTLHGGGENPFAVKNFRLHSYVAPPSIGVPNDEVATL
jgi:hypothetical protein